MPIDVKSILQRHESLKRVKQNWMPFYQALSQYVMMRKQYFTTEQNEGPFLLNKVFDSTALHAAHMMAASCLGQIWPNPFESFEFRPQIAQDEELFSDAFEMMNTVNDVMPTNLALPEARVMPSLLESFTDGIVFGTAALASIQTNDYACPVKIKPMDTKTMSIAENEYGEVDTVYMEKNFTVAKLVQRFGFFSVSDRIKKLYDEGKLEECVKVLHLIEPRRERNPLKLGVQDMPFASIIIEIDTKHVLEESGFEEMPITVFRFWQNVGEVYGRSPAMDAMPDIRALNKLVEMFERAGEMGLDPPKMISTEDVLGSGKPPWGPGAWIPVHASGRLGSDRPPIETIGTVQNPSWAVQRITDLRDNVKEYFMLSILSDLNNTSRQTLGEANIRNELRMYMSAPPLVRMLLELVSPLLDRSFNIMLGMGMFGVVRGSVQDIRMRALGLQPKYISEDFISSRTAGLKGYRINFLCPAARLMKMEEAQGLERLINFTAGLATIDPGVTKNINADEALRSGQRLYGASQKILYTPAEVEAGRQVAAQQQMEMQQMQQAMTGAAAFKDAAKGVKDLGAA